MTYLIYGATGYLGANIVKCLEKRKIPFIVSSVRIENQVELDEEMQRLNPKFCICAAGITGKPNISWCDEHPHETLQANVIGQLNVVEVCRRHGVRVVLFGTCCFYSGLSGDGKRTFQETDEPNFVENVYTKLRLYLEKILETCSFGHVINLRIIYPLSSDALSFEYSTLSKLLRYPTIYNAATSWSVVDDLFPLIPRMLENDQCCGTYNFINPGVMDHRSLFEVLKIKDFDFQSKIGDGDGHAVRRGHPHMCTDKLQSLFPDFEIPDIHESVKAMAVKLKFEDERVET